LIGFALFGASYLFSLYCGAVMHYTALDIGRVFLLAGLAQVFLMPLIGKMANKVDPRYMLFFGVAMATWSQWICANLTADADFYHLVWPNLIRSLGLGFVFIPVSIAALSDLPPEQRGNATGLFNLTRELGGSLGTAWMGKVVADGIAVHSTEIGQHVSIFDPATIDSWTQIARSGLDPAMILGVRVSRESMVLSFNDGFRLTMMAVGLGLVMVLILKKAASAAAPAGAH
jgi:DHA2 family multidrug resistance protein